MDWDTERSSSTDIGLDGEVEDETGNLEQRRKDNKQMDWHYVWISTRRQLFTSWVLHFWDSSVQVVTAE